MIYYLPHQVAREHFLSYPATNEHWGIGPLPLNIQMYSGVSSASSLRVEKWTFWGQVNCPL